MDTQSGRLHLHHPVQKDHLIQTTTHEDLCWDYHTWQDYQKSLIRIYKSHNLHMYHKPANTLHSMVVHPKDKTPKEHKCGTIYNITCDTDSSHTYIGETKRTPSQRFKEHTNLDKPTGVGDHCRATGHSVSMKNTEILMRESNWHKRKVKEAIYIKQRAPTMNRDQGYHLPAIYNQIIPPKSEATHVTPVREQGP